MNHLSNKTLKEMRVEYHIIDLQIYNKNKYQTELVYRLSYSIICNYIPKDAVYNSTWLYLHNQNYKHQQILLYIVNELKKYNDIIIDGFFIDINLALTNYRNNILIITNKITDKINLLDKDNKIEIIKLKNEMQNNEVFNKIFNKIISEYDSIKTFNFILDEYKKDNITFSFNEYFDYYKYFYYNDDLKNEYYDIYYNNKLGMLNEDFIKYNAERDADKTYNYILSEYKKDNITFSFNEYFEYDRYYYYNNDSNNLTYDFYYNGRLDTIIIN